MIRHLYSAVFVLFGLYAGAQNDRTDARLIKTVNFYIFNEPVQDLNWYDADFMEKQASRICKPAQFDIRAEIRYAPPGDTRSLKPVVFDNHPYLDPNRVFIPYDSLVPGMVLSLFLRDRQSQACMTVQLMFDHREEYAQGDVHFRFNYIPFRPGIYEFNGSDIEHWDMEIATLNESNCWIPQ